MDTTNKRVLLFFASALLIGVTLLYWNTVSWIFNYRQMFGLTHDFFNPYQESELLAGSFSSETIDYSSTYSLVIPDIGLFTPVFIAKSTEKQVLNDALDNGAVHYPGSVWPGQKGQIIILGHSAPPDWPYVKHDWIFSQIQKLAIGNDITLKYDGKEYTYRVVEKEIVEPGHDVSAPGLSKDNNILTLVSCWPPGGNEQRIAITAKLIS